MIYISDLRESKINDQVEISALVDGFRLWYRFPANCPYSLSPNPFIAAAFFPAALTGETVKVDSGIGVSPQLITGIDKLQEIFGSWRKDLHPFSIEAEKLVPHPTNDRVCAFFSGGIDGLYTVGLHEEEITDLIYVNGFDFEMDASDFEIALQRVQKQADLYSKKVIPVETNFYEFNKLKSVSRPWTHGSCLASIALVIGFSKWYISSSYTYYDLRPWGSHPLTDRFWSTEAVQVVHDSAALGRAAKIREVAKKPGALDDLIVCWDYADMNCGNCVKCTRTMTTLAILGISNTNFPRIITPSEVSRFTLAEMDSFNVYDNLALAIEEGDSEMEAALKKIIEPRPIKEIIKNLDKLLFGGSVIKTFKRLMASKGIHH